jgi:hypothetical protein
MCVLCWDFVIGLCAEIDGFNVCVLLELSDSVYGGVVIACVVCVHAKMCVVQRNCDSLPKLCRLQQISIRCRNWIFCSELAFTAESCVVHWICDLLPILCRLQRISIRCWIMCSAANLGFAVETVSFAAN